VCTVSCSAAPPPMVAVVDGSSGGDGDGSYAVPAVCCGTEGRPGPVLQACAPGHRIGQRHLQRPARPGTSRWPHPRRSHCPNPAAHPGPAAAIWHNDATGQPVMRSLRPTTLTPWNGSYRAPGARTGTDRGGTPSRRGGVIIKPSCTRAPVELPAAFPVSACHHYGRRQAHQPAPQADLADHETPGHVPDLGFAMSH
jgi:hypothetical protein